MKSSNNQINIELVDAIKRLADNENKRQDYEDYRTIIKEIHHYMATPLAQMESALDSLSTWSENNKCEEIVPRKIKSLQRCFGLIYSIIKSYREMSHLEYGDKSDEDLLVSEGVLAAFTTYNEQSNKKLTLKEENIPTQIDKYSNNIIVMLLLPLIQNAISYAKTNTFFEIKYFDREDHHVFLISNVIEKAPNIDKMNNEIGYSCKENHKGNGIYIAKNILRTLRNSSLVYSIDGVIANTEVKIGRVK